MDQRLAKVNGTRIAAAFKGTFNKSAKQIAEEWLKENPVEKSSKSRQEAIKFLRTILTTDGAGLTGALKKTYGDFAALGKASADEMLGNGKVTNWDTWKPGNGAAAALLEPKGALKQILADREIKLRVKGITNTKIDQIGTALAEGLSRGDNVTMIAKAINEVIGSPTHALLIANTEGARAMVAASTDRYEEAGVSKFEWIVSDPCDICESNEAESRGGVPFGHIFNDGSEYPPAHPNCRCDIVPVVDSAFD